MQLHMTAGAAPISQEGFEVLQCAVRVARDEQVRSLAALRVRLDALYPKRSTDIEQAICFWSAYVKRTGTANATA